jgi:NADP-dependent 3-hydroxy acid dehydrogenase YdfG
MHISTAAQYARCTAQVLTSAVDVADAAAMSAFVAQVESEAAIDLVVANAGVMAEDLPLGQALRQVGSSNVTGRC